MSNTTLEGGGASSGEAVPHSDMSREEANTGEGLSETAIIGTNATTILQETPEQERERKLNAGCTREMIMQSGACELITINEELCKAMSTLRRGYPDKQYAEQSHGQEFRENADLIISAIAEQTLQGLDPNKVVVLMPWRAGLAFSKCYLEHGVHRFYHVSSRRDEETLETIVDYESGNIEKGDTVIMADPMLATGNTARDSIHRMLASGVTPEQIIVNAVVAAPIGVQTVKHYPAIRVVAGALDEKLDHRGYIVPGLGDFGDKYCGDLTGKELVALANALRLEPAAYQKLQERFRAHAN